MKKILRILANFSSMAMLATVLAFGLMVAGCPSGGDDEKEALTGSVTIGGTAQVGQTLMANTNSLGGSGAITYQWLRGGTEPIGANRATYQVAAADVGKTITVRVTRADNTGHIDSAPTGAVPPANASALSGTVTISGTAQVGQTLTANTGSLGGSGAITYQWLRDRTEPIGANQDTYQVAAADEGKTITVRVTRADNTGHIDSAPTGAVPPANASALSGTVTISGTAQVGQTLMANTNSLDGSGTIAYQWLRGGTEPIGANQDTYQVAAADEGKTITVRVTRADNTGYVDSAPTGAVSGTPNASFTITFNQIADAAPAITGPTLYRVSHTGPTTETLTVENPAQYDSIAWRVQDGATTAGTDASFTLNAANTGYNLIGEHFVTLEVVKDGVTYNKTVSFTVAY